jgi:hypothetical protein
VSDDGDVHSQLSKEDFCQTVSEGVELVSYFIFQIHAMVIEYNLNVSDPSADKYSSGKYDFELILRYLRNNISVFAKFIRALLSASTIVYVSIIDRLSKLAVIVPDGTPAHEFQYTCKTLYQQLLKLLMTEMVMIKALVQLLYNIFFSEPNSSSCLSQLSSLIDKASEVLATSDSSYESAVGFKMNHLDLEVLKFELSQKFRQQSNRTSLDQAVINFRSYYNSLLSVNLFDRQALELSSRLFSLSVVEEKGLNVNVFTRYLTKEWDVHDDRSKDIVNTGELALFDAFFTSPKMIEEERALPIRANKRSRDSALPDRDDVWQMTRKVSTSSSQSQPQSIAVQSETICRDDSLDILTDDGSVFDSDEDF